MIPHRVTIQNTMNQQQGLDELANGIFSLLAPDDTGMIDTRLVQG